MVMRTVGSFSDDDATSLAVRAHTTETKHVKQITADAEHVPGTKKAKKAILLLLSPVILGVGIALLPVAVVVGGVGIASAKTWHTIKPIIMPKSPAAKCKELKKAEERHRLEELKKVEMDRPKIMEWSKRDSEGIAVKLEWELTKNVSSYLKDKGGAATRQRMLERHVDRFVLAQGQGFRPSPEQTRALKQAFLANYPPEHQPNVFTADPDFNWGAFAVLGDEGLEKKFKDYMIQHQDEISSGLLAISEDPQTRQKDIKAFEKAILDLHKTIQDPNKDPAGQNVAITKKLRNALACQAYQALKHDPECESVKYLHKLAYAMHTSSGAATGQADLIENLAPSQGLEAELGPLQPLHVEQKTATIKEVPATLTEALDAARNKLAGAQKKAEAIQTAQKLSEERLRQADAKLEQLCEKLETAREKLSQASLLTEKARKTHENAEHAALLAYYSRTVQSEQARDLVESVKEFPDDWPKGIVTETAVTKKAWDQAWGEEVKARGAVRKAQDAIPGQEIRQSIVTRQTRQAAQAVQAQAAVLSAEADVQSAEAAVVSAHQQAIDEAHREEFARPVKVLNGSRVAKHFYRAKARGRKTLQLSDGGIFNSLAYGLKNPGQIRGAVASLGGWKRALTGAIYDPHLLPNNSSLHGTTPIDIMDSDGSGAIKVSCKIQNIHGPSPTVASQVAPEFLALCQGAENNLLWAKAHDGVPDPNLPVKVVVTNMQKLNESAGEGVRSKALMELNTMFPGVCKVLTLSKDSDFYKMPEREEDMDKIPPWTSTQDFSEEMRAALGSGVGRTAEDISRDKGVKAYGIYFPPSVTPELLKNALNVANQRFSEGFVKARFGQPPLIGEAAFKLRGAYQEYVYQLIQRQLEIEAVKELAEEGIKGGNIIFKASCKEHADRGGMNSMAMAYLRAEIPPGATEADIQQLSKFVIGSGLYRALAAKERMVLDDRVPNILAMVECVSPQDFREDVDLMNVGSDIHVGIFQPSIDEEVEVQRAANRPVGEVLEEVADALPAPLALFMSSHQDLFDLDQLATVLVKNTVATTNALDQKIRSFFMDKELEQFGIRFELDLAVKISPEELASHEVMLELAKQLQENITDLVLIQVLSGAETPEKTRAKKMQYFVKVAQQCFESGNYFAADAIVKGLLSAEVLAGFEHTIDAKGGSSKSSPYWKPANAARALLDSIGKKIIQGNHGVFPAVDSIESKIIRWRT